MQSSIEERPAGLPPSALHAIFKVALAQSVLVILAGLNLILRVTKTPLAGFRYVRWRELIVLGLITPASVGLVFYLFSILEGGRRDARRPLVCLGVMVALLCIGMGVHEPANTLGRIPQYLASSIWFWDEVFGHTLFFAAFSGLSLTVLWMQTRNPLAMNMSRPQTLVFVVLAVAAGVGIFLTLVPGGAIVWDLSVMALTLLASESIRRGLSLRRLPLAIVIEGSILLALLALLLQRGWSGCG